jgi:hypothetical protein
VEIKVTKIHKVKFSVRHFEGTEGGMDTGAFGVEVDTLEQAIDLLERANGAPPYISDREWVIVASVKTTVS